MRWLVLPLASLTPLLTPTPAEASGCFLGPYTTTSDPPLGCEVVLYEHENQVSSALAVTAKRGAETVTIDATATTAMTQLDARYTNYACDGSIIYDAVHRENYVVSRITLTGAQVGDQLFINGMGIGFVGASGACVEDISRLTPFCTGRNSGYPCEGDGGGSGSGSGSGDAHGEGDLGDDIAGCSATNTGSAPVALVALSLLAIVLPRRRRH